MADTLPHHVNPAHLPDTRPRGYSTAVITPATRLVFISGQGGEDARGAYAPNFAAQVAQAYANLAAVVDALGARPDRVAKLTVYVVDHQMSKLGILTGAVVRMFGDHLPAQTLVPVPRLATDPMLFEVDAVVSLD